MRLYRRLLVQLRTSPRQRLTIWAALFGVLCGVLGLLEPVEDTLSMMRGVMRNRPASGDIVVLAIDDRSLAEQGRWPWSRSASASIIDKLNAAGVKSIYFDFAFKGSSDPKEDAVFLDSLKRSKVPVNLAALYEVDRKTHRPNGNLIGLKTPYSNSVVIQTDFNYAGEIRRLPLGSLSEGTLFPTMSTQMAEAKPQLGSYPIDLSIDPGSVPTFSAIDLLKGRLSLDQLKTKAVVVAPTSAALFDIKLYPGRSQTPGVYVMIAGAETLKEGRPVETGWWPLLLVMILIAEGIHRKAVTRPLIPLALGAIALIAAPLAWEPLRFTAEIAPALAFILVLIGNGLWRKAKRAGGLVNTNSGLPNLSALRELPTQGDHALIVMRISNYADIASSLRPDMQMNMIAQIIGRLSLGTGGATLYQCEEGVFAWFKPSADSDAIGDQLDGLHAVLSVPLKIEARSIDLQFSFGVERDGSRSLVNRIGGALMAAEEAKAASARWQDFDPESLETADWRLSMLGQIEDAIEARELWVAFQPQLDLQTGRIDSAEALVRWRHPVRGDIAPNDFVLHAERTGRIDRLTAFVVREAARAAATLNDRGIDFRVSINISATLLDVAYIDELISPIVDAECLAHDRITLEITESAEFKLGSLQADKLDRLRRCGFRISIDDYGTGYSSIEYLKRIDAGEIKIDKSFISQLDHSDKDRKLVRSTIDLAHALGRRVVAEGVETEATLGLLRTMGCDAVQGYLIGRPMTFQSLLALLITPDRISLTA